ncbi:unnamed protein product [Diabrotica balteata]|uniref:Enolase-phosphatase E1 n=1 Tax=Diabrotica balteata TaxID=107213 RepID=A0A9N9T2W8_DIABA|nr:unnamed protein product [Diabrotica balteata]
MSAENSSPALNVEKSIVILLDVAGTTTSNTFLKDTLYSYVTKQAETFLKESWEEQEVKDAVKLIKDDLDQEAAIPLIKELTEKNSDNEGLKKVQGLIYKKGYKSGELKAHVFPDVAPALESWAKSRKIAIYSTGSLESQQLLFTHTTEGDVSAHISKYFDQSSGSKTESASYETISKELEVKPEEILFITDSVDEAKAAKTAGFTSVLITRDGNDALPEEASKNFPVISSFQDVVFDKSVKRKNEEESAPTEVRSNKSRKHK